MMPHCALFVIEKSSMHLKVKDIVVSRMININLTSIFPTRRTKLQKASPQNIFITIVMLARNLKVRKLYKAPNQVSRMALATRDLEPPPRKINLEILQKVKSPINLNGLMMISLKTVFYTILTSGCLVMNLIKILQQLRITQLQTTLYCHWFCTMV